MASPRFFLLSSLLTALFATSSHADSTPQNSAPASVPNVIRLPRPLIDGTTSVEKALRQRRSIRQYKNQAIALSDLSQILWAAQGMTGSGGRRTTPSAGALYPIDVYVVVGAVSGLADGTYAYHPDKS